VTHEDLHPDSGPRQLGTQLTGVAEALGGGPAPPIDPGRVVRFAAEAIRHAQHCGLTLVSEGRRPRSIASTSDVALRVDALHCATRQGPGIEAALDHAVVRVDDLGDDDRWPEFAVRCATVTGIRSILSLGLDVGGDDRAAMSFYSAGVGTFTELDAGMASMFAPFAALAVRGSVRQRDVAAVESALTSSRQIGIAIGILRAREFLTSEEAFDLLRQASENLHRKLGDVAAVVELTGELPGVDDRPT